MNFESTDKFYEQLKNDYRDKAGDDRDIESTRKYGGIDGNAADADIDKTVKQSFLYIYFKGKKDIDAREISRDKDLLFEYRKPKMDKYTLLRGAYMAYKNDIISDEDYKEIFLEANACSKSGQKTREKLFDTNPDKAREELEERLLRDCAERFIDNANRRQSTSHIDVIEMLNQYIIKMPNANEDGGTGFSSAARADLSDDEYIRKCADLYEILLSENEKNEKETADMFVPLYIDSYSGAGVYIIGKHYLDEDTPKVCVISLEDVRKDDELETAIILMMNCERYNSVEKAFDQLVTEISDRDHVEGYRFHNQGFPNGADECFKLLFGDYVREYVDQENKGIKKMNEQENSIVP